MIDLSTKRIYTKRLILKPIEASDVDAIHEYASDQDITMMLYLPNETIDVTKGRTWMYGIRRAIREQGDWWCRR